jgi:hypothetical protein
MRHLDYLTVIGENIVHSTLGFLIEKGADIRSGRHAAFAFG